MTSRFSTGALLALLLAVLPSAHAQTTIAFQGFEPGNSWTISTGNAGISTAPGAGDTPQNSRIRTGTSSSQTIGTTRTFDLAPQSTAGFTGTTVTLRLSSTSTTNGNGADGSDLVRVFANLNGAGFPATADVTVAGNGKARYGYTATGTATTTAGTPVSVANPSSGSATLGIATVTINIPNGTTSVGLRVTTLNDNADELWNIDDITLSGTSIPPVTVAQTLSSNAGFRLLSAPVTNVTVGTLAALNLVQGIAEQYPLAQDNLFLGYTGSNGEGGTENYIGATGEAQTLTPGAGFFWQFYNTVVNSDDVPTATFGAGTSDSRVLGTATDLTATGSPLTMDHSVVFTTATTDKFYMIGNPFARAVDAQAITVAGAAQGTSGIQGDVFQLFKSSAPAGFVTVNRAAATAAARALAVWQGFFAETVTTAAPTFLFDFDAATPGAATFVGRTAAAHTLAITLAGQTASGVATRDEASSVRFAEGASEGWDALDASKLAPPAGPYALVAPVTTRDGGAYRVAISSLPLASALVPLSIFVTNAGTYTLTADGAGLPAGYSVELRDVATGAVSDLTAGYTFTSAATDWTDRFVLAIRAGTATAGEETAAGTVSLSAPRPNPATGTSRLVLRVPTAEAVTATVVDALGRTVATLFDGNASAGTDVTLSVDIRNLAPGTYLVRVQGETFVTSRRLTVVR